MMGWLKKIWHLIQSLRGLGTPSEDGEETTWAKLRGKLTLTGVDNKDISVNYNIEAATALRKSESAQTEAVEALRKAREAHKEAARAVIILERLNKDRER